MYVYTGHSQHILNLHTYQCEAFGALIYLNLGLKIL